MMSVYKYVTPDGALRYLRTQAMRITPPDQFNDPFEMRPTFDLSGLDLMEQAPSLVRKELGAMFAQLAKDEGLAMSVDIAAAGSDAFVSFLMRQMSASDEARFLGAARADGPIGLFDALQTMRTEFDGLYRKAISDARQRLPAFSQMAQAAMHQALPRHIGVLCLSGSGRHPLMWAHYTDCHKGALLEFDEDAPCFNRRRHEDDEFGCLHRVWYADARPMLSAQRNTGALVAMALTKALEWAYEQELRLLWPLEEADRSVTAGNAKVHLIDVPTTALRSVTIGCKAAEEFVKELLHTVGSFKSSIAVRAATIDDHSFSLNYRDLS